MLPAKSKNYIEGQPNVNDVLYGSGKGAYNHNGNQVFHAKVSQICFVLSLLCLIRGTSTPIVILINNLHR